MIFSSWTFGIFFVVVFGGYWSLRARHSRHVLLLAASYFFYMSWNPWLISLIIASTLLDYFVGAAIHRSEAPRRRKWLLALSLAGNLGILATFKYADFFIVSFREMLHACGIHANLDTLSIILPIGISFYTFQTLSYTIDIYRRQLAPTRSFLDFALFVAFFPQLVAGPIVKARDFLPQLDTIKRFEWGRLEAAAVLFLVGLTKKLLIADSLAIVVDPVFARPECFVTRDLWLAMFCYGGQIYCDFSGYSDMAIATASVLGFDLRKNFANPYLAVGLRDFWHRWHISLSTWLRDYLYIPLGGSRQGEVKTYRNLMTTMLLGGLWHGASWTFVVWGAIHGVALAVCRFVQTLLRGRAGAAPQTAGATGGTMAEMQHAETGTSLDSRRLASGPADAGNPFNFLPRPIRILITWAATLVLVHIAWVFFRCQPFQFVGQPEPEPTVVALERATYFVTHLFIPADVADPVWLKDKVPMVILLCLMGVMQLYDEWCSRGRPHLRLPAPVAGMGYAAWILALVICCPQNTGPFIYFQF